jgi:CheY-like chemotaxis protein
VEDDPGDQILTQEAFKALKVPHQLRIVSDGEQALEYLYHKGCYESAAKAPRPDLVLLDLNMPRVNGQQVAERIHADPDLRTIPIVVLTISQRQEDVLQAYAHGVTSYIGKSLDFSHFMADVQGLERLIKLLLAFKNLRSRIRVSNRQVCRLVRRKQQLQRRADLLFGQYMQRIEAGLQLGGGEPAREALLSRSEGDLPVGSSLTGQREGESRFEEYAGTAGLIELARLVENWSDKPEPQGARDKENRPDAEEMSH